MAATELGIRLSVDGADAASSAIKGVSSSMDGLGSSAGNATAGLKKAASDLEKVEMSAKATAAALRNVPAQFTDIAVGLASGQAPLTVLLQQGGQLQDMFGGVGNAAKALGGYMASLITPFSAAAAAAGTLGYAYYAGAKEIDAYNKALILTGNAIGLTSGQLQDMASHMARISGTQGKAAETLAAFASAGDVGADSLQKFSQAAIAFEKATGSAVEETVKQFSKLGEKPLEASIKLNESTNFLTMSIYQQIKALEEQGKHTEAAQVAQDAYADTINQRAGQITANLGTIERGWLAIVSASKQAWDAIKDIGREDSVGAKIIKAQQEMVDILKNGDLIKYGGLSRADAISAQITKIRQLQEDEKLGNLTAKAQSQQAERVKAEIAWDALRKKHLSDQEKMELAITDAIEKGNAARKSQAEILDEINHIIDKGPKVEKGRAKSEAVERFSNELTATKQWLATQEKMIQESYSAQQKSIEESYKSQEISAAQYYSRQLANDEKALRDSEKVRAEAKARFDAEMAERVATTEARKPSQARTTALENLRNEAAQFALAQEAARQKERNSIAAHGDDMAREIDKQSQKVTESVDTYIADMQRRAQADAALVAAREAMAGQSPEIIAGMAAEMKVRADAAKILEQTAKAYAKAAEDARTFEDELASNFADGKEATNAERLLLETLQSSAKRARRSLIELGGAVDTTALDASVTATTASIKKQTDEVAKEVQKTLVDGIMSAGKDGGAGLRKAIEDVLITRPFRIVVEAMLQPVSTAIAQGIMGQTLGTGANVGGISSALNAASLAASTFGSNALEAAKAVTIEGASFGDVVSIISSDFAAGKFAAGIGGAVGAAAPFAIAAVAAQSLFNAMQGSVTPTGTFLYGGQGRFGGRQDFNQSGGVFGGGNTKNSSWFDPAPEVAKYMGAVESTITTSVKGWASAIGLSADAVDSYSKQVEVSIGGLDAKGTKDAIDKAFAGFGDDLTKAAYGLSSDTLKTLATNLQGVNAVFESVGMSALEASMGSAELATSIVTAAGSLDNLSKITGAAYDAMTSPAQKAADSAGKLDKAFASLGVSTPKTVQDLVQLAKAQDLTSDAGRKAAVGILSLLPALQQVQDGVKAAREAMLRDAGINNGDISSIVKKGLIEGNLKNAGGEISDTIMAGIQNALYGKMADAITNSFTNEMLAPLLEAMQKGKSLPEALASVDWTQVKSKFQQTVDDVSAIFNNAQVSQGIGALKGAIQDLFSTSSYAIPKGLVIAQDTTKAATGGLITGPGTGTSDSIPAMLSNGEYVINARAASNLGSGFLDALNTGTIARRANGGYVWNPMDGSRVVDAEIGFTPAYDQYRRDMPGMAQLPDNAIAALGFIPTALQGVSQAVATVTQATVVATKSAEDLKSAYESLSTDSTQTYIDVMRSMGETTKATSMAIAKATDGFDALHVAVYREIEAGKTLVSMRETLAQAETTYAQSGVDLLTAKGDTTGAAALQRSLDLADVSAQKTAASARLLNDGLSENEKSYQAAIIATADQTIALYDQQKAREQEISILNERTTLQDELNSLTDTAAQALQRQRDALDDSNRALFDQVQAAKEAKENASWQDKIDVLTKVATQREIDQRNALNSATDESTKALINQYYAQVDWAEALDKATALADSATAALKGQQTNSSQLDVAYLTATGDTAGAAAAQKAIDLADVYKTLDDATQELATTTDAEVKAKLQSAITDGQATIALYETNKRREAEIETLKKYQSAATNAQSALASSADMLANSRAGLLEAQGDTAGAAALRRSLDIKPYLDAITEATTGLGTATTQSEKDLLNLTISTSKQAISNYDAAKALDAQAQAATAAQEAANNLASAYNDLKGQIEQANIALMRTSGNTTAADELEFAIATREHEGDVYYATLQRELVTLRKLTEARQTLNGLEDSALQNQIKLKRAQGEGVLANAIERSAFLKNAALPAAAAKAELDRSNASFVEFLQSKNITALHGFNAQNVFDSLAKDASYENRKKIADLNAPNSDQQYVSGFNAQYAITADNNPISAWPVLQEFASMGRTESQKANLQGVVDTAQSIAAAYDRNKALEAELKIIELQDEAYKQSLDAQKAVSDAQKNYADVLRSTIETMRDFIATLDGGASPLQNLSTARANFQTVAGRAASGDTSAYKDLTPAARALLDLSKNYSRSIQDYQRDEAKVRATLNAVIRVNQNELDKLPKEIAEAADPTKEAWTKLQEAINKQTNTVVMLDALQVDQEASKRRLRTAEETLSDRYIEAVSLLDETKKTSLLDAFNTAVKSKVDETTLPDYSLTFDLGKIWNDKIAGVLPNTPLTNADLNTVIATKFPGLVPSDFVTALTPTQLSDLVSGKLPEKLTAVNLISKTADVSDLVGARINTIIPPDFAGEKFDAKQMMQTAINNAMSALGGTNTPDWGAMSYETIATQLGVTLPNPNNLGNANFINGLIRTYQGSDLGRQLEEIAKAKGTYQVTTQNVSPGTGVNAGASTTAGASMSSIEVANRLGLPVNALDMPDYLRGILANYTDPEQYAYQKTFGNGIDQKIADLKSYGKSRGYPGFSVGTNYVPHDMLAQIHQGEAIIPAPFNPERYGRASGNDALVEEIKALREEVSRLRAEQRAGQNAIAANTRKTAQVLVKFDTDGMPATQT